MDNDIQSRREFFRHMGQGMTFLGLLASSGYLLYTGTPDCHNQGVCAQCGVYNGCELDHKKELS